MRCMRFLLIIVVALTGALLSVNPCGAANKLSYDQWLQERITEAKTISRGSSQASMLRIFRADAGDHPAPYRYLLKSCQLIWVEVSFGFLGVQDPHKPHEDIAGPSVVSISHLFVGDPTRPTELSPYEKQLRAFLDDCLSIKPGMSRAALLVKFVPEAGLQPMLPTRYVHKQCALVKIDVTFDAPPGTKASAPSAVADKDLAIKTVSRPYVDLAICD